MRGLARHVAAVAAGFFAMSACAFAFFAVAFAALGEARVFRDRTYAVSGEWALVSLALGFVAALVGGAACRSIARRPAPVWTLTAIAVLFGVVYALIELLLLPGEAGERLLEAGWLEAQCFSRNPRWLLYAIPVIDALGISLGSQLAVRSERTPPRAG